VPRAVLFRKEARVLICGVVAHASRALESVKGDGNIRLEVPLCASRSFNSTGEIARKRKYAT